MPVIPLLKYWKAITFGLVVVLVAGLWALSAYRGHRIDELRSEVGDYQKTVKALQEASKASAQASEKNAAEVARIEKEKSNAKDAIRSAPAGDDAPVAPVLRDAIMQLYLDRP